MTREEALNVIWLRCQHNDKTYEAYCVLKHEQQPCDDATLKDIFCIGCEYKEQKPICPSAGIDCEDCPASSSEKPRLIDPAYEKTLNKWIGAEVLDRIRNEIDEQYDRVHPYNISCAEGLEMALNIIDKYREPTGTESEDKE